MSRSTFSSSSENAFLCSDSFSSLSIQEKPLCPFNGHAFVYHAKVPCKSERCRNLEKKDNPNCFVKAFRWYTQEHKVPKRSKDRSDLDEFAAWLDQKYDQFLYDSQRKNAYESRLRILSSVRIESNKPCNLSRRCRRAADCRNGGDGFEKCNQSFEVIMQAKELSRPASECCFQNRLASYCNSSKVTVASSDTVVIKKWSKFNKKDSCENQQTEFHMTTPEAKVMEITELNESDAISFPQNAPLAEEKYSQNNSETPYTHVQCQCSEGHVVIMETSTQCDNYTCQNQAEIQPTAITVTEARRAIQASKFSAQVTPSNEKDATPSCHPRCLYPKEHVKIDHDTQYSDHEPTSESACAKCECPVSKLHTNLEMKMAHSHQNMGSNTKNIMASRKNSIKEMCNCKIRRREVSHKWACEDTPTMLVSDTAQTSDHSIILDNDVCEFPLLVRIVNLKVDQKGF